MNIEKLAKFFHSSNSSNDVPFRLFLMAGQYSGFDLDKEQTKELLKFLQDGKNYNKEKFQGFLEEWIYPKERAKNEL